MRWTLLLLIAACSPYDDNFGESPFLCGASEPRCPRDYSCVPEANGREVCVRGNVDQIECADDGAREPNETTSEPTVTTIDAESSFVVTGSAVCPDGDRDVYSLSLADVSTVEAIITLDPGGAVLEAAILNTGGVPIAMATPALEANTLRAVASDLDPGVYYVQVNGPEGAQTTNNYALTINVN
jgi:hypothetical protein